MDRQGAQSQMRATADEIEDRYLRWARDFENLAQTYREVRLHGPANDAEAWKNACEFQAARCSSSSANATASVLRGSSATRAA
jgi:hypothetical protein